MNKGLVFFFFFRFLLKFFLLLIDSFQSSPPAFKVDSTRGVLLKFFDPQSYPLERWGGGGAKSDVRSFRKFFAPLPQILWAFGPADWFIHIDPTIPIFISEPRRRFKEYWMKGEAQWNMPWMNEWSRKRKIWAIFFSQKQYPATWATIFAPRLCFWSFKTAYFSSIILLKSKL